jgi:palmitoyltransferase
VANSITLFTVGVICVRSLYSLALNTTTIESWEIERHRLLLRRARACGGYLSCPDGSRIYLKKQEFPYDVGILRNIWHGMAGGPWWWLMPLAPSPPLHGGQKFDVNDFEGKPGCTFPSITPRN